jgi:hypothetical protein
MSGREPVAPDSPAAPAPPPDAGLPSGPSLPIRKKRPMPLPHERCGNPKWAGMRRTHHPPSRASLVLHVPNPRLPALPHLHRKPFLPPESPHQQREPEPLPPEPSMTPPGYSMEPYPQSAAGGQTNLVPAPHRIQSTDLVLQICKQTGPRELNGARRQILQAASGPDCAQGRVLLHCNAHNRTPKLRLPSHGFLERAGTRKQRVDLTMRRSQSARPKKRSRQSIPSRSPHPRSS